MLEGKIIYPEQNQTTLYLSRISFNPSVNIINIYTHSEDSTSVYIYMYIYIYIYLYIYISYISIYIYVYIDR